MLPKKTAAGIALALLSGASLADWQLIGSNGNEFSLFADPDTKRRSANIVTMTEMVTYGEPQAAAAGSRHYLSEKSQVEYDCTGKRARVIVSEKYAGPRVSGSLVHRDSGDGDKWMPIPGRTNMEELWRLACDRV